MLEKELNKLIEDANKIRQQSLQNQSSSYYNDVFYDLTDFISKKTNNPFLKNKIAPIIASHFDEILPYIVASNTNIILLNINLLMEQPDFKQKFIDGLKKYPYKDEIDQLFYSIFAFLNKDLNKLNNFIDSDFLEAISTMDLNKRIYLDILNKLSEENQREFLNLLVENKCDIPYSEIVYKGNNKEIIYNNLPLFIENAQNLYALLDFVKDNPIAISQVKHYIDNNEEKAINSIFCGIDNLGKMEDPTLKEIVKLIVLDVMKNENVKLSDITYNGGRFSRVLLIGDKVIKLGDRATKYFPNNPYIIAPLLRKEFESNGKSCFVEVTERVDTSTTPSHEELYQLFKKIRDLNLAWTDVHVQNVGRLRKENIIHWRENIKPTEEVLGLDNKRGETILKEGDLVVLDADFIYDENDPNLIKKGLFFEFEDRYQKEIKEMREKNIEQDVGNRRL